jgi:ribose 5-phosphate isomerase A
LKAENDNSGKALEAMVEKLALEMQDGSLIGLGSGSTVAAFARRLGQRAEKEKLHFSVVPSSLQIQIIAEKYLRFMVMPSTMIPNIDITVDGVDQIDEKFRMIKGGGGALYRERVLLQAANKRVILADETKHVKQLYRSVPVETSFFARDFTESMLLKMGGKPKLRSLEKGYPFITENGNVIFDTDFGTIEEPETLRADIKSIAGVIEAGIFLNECDVLYQANQDGSVQVFEVR